MNYLEDVGERLQDPEYNVAWGLFHLPLYNREPSRGFGLRFRSVTLHLPQPVAAAIKYPPFPTCPHLVRRIFQNRRRIILAFFSLDGDTRPLCRFPPTSSGGI